MAKLKVEEIDKYQRIQVINLHIKQIQETIYPDRMQEVREVMIRALEERIDAIVEGRV